MFQYLIPHWNIQTLKSVFNALVAGKKKGNRAKVPQSRKINYFSFTSKQQRLLIIAPFERLPVFSLICDSLSYSSGRTAQERKKNPKNAISAIIPQNIPSKTTFRLITKP